MLLNEKIISVITKFALVQFKYKNRKYQQREKMCSTTTNIKTEVRIFGSENEKIRCELAIHIFKTY